MKKILLSLVTIALIGAGVAGVTTAFYGDTERSTGNTFTAGSLELLVDSEAHYNNMICVDTGDGDPRYQWQPFGDFVPGPEHYPPTGSACDGTWSETDLQDGVHKFFNFDDLKPGDFGEVTISLHVYDNDAWGQFEFETVRDADNTCTEPETEAEANTTVCSDPDGDGEIDDNLFWTGWVDHGAIAGFQCGDPNASSTGAGCEADPTEGDNIYQDNEGPRFWLNELISETGPFDMQEVLSAAYSIFNCDSNGNENGHNEYGECQGLAVDGRLVGSTTYYFGLAWDFPLETGNEISTDEYTADMVFRIEQMRNNPNPFGGGA